MGIETAFDGASQGFRLQQKGLLRGSPDSYAARELQLLWARSHHLCRNNPAAVTAKNRLVAHQIGTGIKVKWDNKKVQKAWDEFVADPSADGFGSIHNIQSVWGGALFESGEVFTRMLIKKGKGKIPLKLQVLEAEQLDPRYSMPNIRNGIQFEASGLSPTYYHFWKRHPSHNLMAKLNERVAVKAESVLHMFNRDRPGQWRGIPKLTPAMLTIYEMDELTDAALVRQKAAQAVGWIIKKTEAGALPLLGGMEEVAEELPAETEDDMGGSKIQKILPGGVHYLQKDEDFTFASIDDIGSNFVSLLEHNWRMIASCLDVTYEQLTGDLSGANFASMRAGLIEFRKRITLSQQLVFVNLGMIPLTEYFKELCSVYINREAGAARATFVFPKQEWVDPLKDAQADVLEIRAGLATLRAKLEERGVEDVEEHIQRVIEEQGYGVILSSNPKHEIKESSKTEDKQ